MKFEMKLHSGEGLALSFKDAGKDNKMFEIILVKDKKATTGVVLGLIMKADLKRLAKAS